MRTRDNQLTITHDFIKGHEYEVVVAAVEQSGRQQEYEDSPKASIVIEGKSVTPSRGSDLTVTASLGKLTLTWTNPSDYDFDVMEIWRSSVYVVATATKVAEVRSDYWTDIIGTVGTTYYYWIRARNKTGDTSGFHPTGRGVSGTTTGIEVTDIGDFALPATKLFTSVVVLSGDAWTNNSPSAGKIAWNTHYIVYGGKYYEVVGDNTDKKYIYWDVGYTSGAGTVSDPYHTTYTPSDTYSASGSTRFMIVVNESGTHQLVWNSSANMVIGSAFILNLDVDKLTANAASTNEFVSNSAQIKSLIVTDAKINDLDVDKLTANAASTNEFVSNTAQIKDAIITNAKISTLDAGKINTGVLVVARTEAKCTDPLADQTSVNTAADTAKVQGSTLIVGGYIDTAFLTATNIQTGTLTAITVQTASGTGQRIVLSQADNSLKFYDSTNYNVIDIDADICGYGVPGMRVEGNGGVGGDGCAFFVRNYDGGAIDSYVRITPTNITIQPDAASNSIGLYINALGASAGGITIVHHSTNTIPFLSCTRSTEGFEVDKDANVNSTGVYKVSGTQVVGAQGAAVGDATAVTGTPTDSGVASSWGFVSEAQMNTALTNINTIKTQLNLLLARDRAHGLIAT